MPATEVNPSLRRRLSDDARQLLRSAFDPSRATTLAVAPRCAATDHSMAAGKCGNGIKALSLAERLQNFRGQIRLELPDVGDASVRLRIVVSGTSYLLRCQVESIGAEVAVFNKAGSMTSWITASDARTIQLRTFLNADSSPRSECKQIASLLDILEILDLFDVFRASLSAVAVAAAANPQQDAHQEIFCATSDKNLYVFAFDSATGCLVAVTQSAVVESAASSSIAAQFSKLRMIIEDYVRSEDGNIDIPHGIKSDVELMIDTAMTCFSQWSFEAQQRVMELFDVIDKDGDGCISSEDVYDQLVAAGQSEHQSTSIVVEMSRLLCDASNPPEELQFYKFCGFWITMLADGYRVSDPANETTVRAAFESLFLGAAAVAPGV